MPLAASSLSRLLTQFNLEKTTKLLIVGYSPTGGGHTGRLLQIIDHALQQDTLPKDSIVIFHAPPAWENVQRRGELQTLANKLASRGIHVLLTESTKPVYGYLDDKTGGSDDAKILERLASNPLRYRNNRPALLPDISHRTRTLSPETFLSNILDINKLPVIESADLFSHLKKYLDIKTFQKRIYVLTDMDYSLQKSAAKAGVPAIHRLDQQNHAILLDPKNSAMNLLPKYALLAKVLGGTFENISHISLGEKNTLSSVKSTADILRITSASGIREAHTKIIQLLQAHALPLNAVASALGSGALFAGVIAGSRCMANMALRNIVYVYAHKKSNLIAQHVLSKISQNDEHYSRRIFLFCGAKAVGNYNALHLAYLADADGITTAGAGTNGEFSYLHRNTPCKSRLLVLPIEGHNEQLANTRYLSSHAATRDFIYQLEVNEKLDAALDKYVSTEPDVIDTSLTLAALIEAISSQETYVSKAHDILFRQLPLANDSQRLKNLEEKMNQSAVLKATRRYLKIVLQGMQALASSPTGSISIWYSDKATNPVHFASPWELGLMLENNKMLSNAIEISETEMPELPLRQQVAKLFKDGSKNWNTLFINEMNVIKHRLGDIMITGF